MEAWWDRNSAIGAWQYSIPPDATPGNHRLGPLPRQRPQAPLRCRIRLFRWRNYRDYGTGVAGDLFVHLFSGLHFVTGAIGPSAGLFHWRPAFLERWPRRARRAAGCLRLSDNHGKPPAFNLALRVNFVNGGSETSGFRFVGSEGTLAIGNGVTVLESSREKPNPATPSRPSPSHANRVPPRVPARNIRRRSHGRRHPAAERRALPATARLQRSSRPPPQFFRAPSAARQPVIEDAVFGLRAAGPALLSNISHFDERML